MSLFKKKEYNVITLTVEGMKCGMCETHVNNAVRNSFKVKKVSSSHSKGETVIISEEPIDEARLRAAMPDGYELLSMTSEPYTKKGLFHW